MDIPQWAEFWAKVSASSGLIALVLVDIIIRFTPEWLDKELERAKKYLAMIATVVIPIGVSHVMAWLPAIDPTWWVIIYIAGTYAVHEWLFRFVQKPVVERLDVWLTR